MSYAAQVQLDFEPSLAEQYDSLSDVVRAVVWAYPKQSVLAAACDLSPSEFSKKLNGYEGRVMGMDMVLPIILTTGDMRPIHWLAAKACHDEEAKQKAAVAELTRMLPALQAALKTLGKP